VYGVGSFPNLLWMNAPGSTIAAYDEHADWYNAHMSPDGVGDYVRRVHTTLAVLLGPGSGTCLDVCCGTGAHADPLSRLGWSPVGIDLSRNQLRHAAPRLPVALADATALPLADGSVPAAVCVLASTDVPDYAAVLREIARVLTPGGRFVHIGVHPCFVGAFADRTEAPRVVVHPAYTDRSHTYAGGSPNGVRARVGAWHVPLADLLNGAAKAGLHIVRTAEEGEGGVPELFAFAATSARSDA